MWGGQGLCFGKDKKILTPISHQSAAGNMWPGLLQKVWLPFADPPTLSVVTVDRFSDTSGSGITQRWRSISPDAQQFVVRHQCALTSFFTCLVFRFYQLVCSSFSHPFKNQFNLALTFRLSFESEPVPVLKVTYFLLCKSSMFHILASFVSSGSDIYYLSHLMMI